jgi:hypothetical protein
MACSPVASAARRRRGRAHDPAVRLRTLTGDGKFSRRFSIIMTQRALAWADLGLCWVKALQGGAHGLGDRHGFAGGAVDEDVDEPANGYGFGAVFDEKADGVTDAGAAEFFDAQAGLQWDSAHRPIWAPVWMSRPPSFISQVLMTVSK